jgi:hypothetical protein
LIKNPEMIVLMIVDKYDPDESSATEATIPADNGWTPPERGEEVIVGIAVWKLEPGSRRVEHFQPSSSVSWLVSFHGYPS